MELGKRPGIKKLYKVRSFVNKLAFFLKLTDIDYQEDKF